MFLLLQISSLTEEQQVALVPEASKLTAQLEAACTLEATSASWEDTDESWTIPTNRGRHVVLTRKNPNSKNYYDCLPKTQLD